MESVCEEHWRAIGAVWRIPTDGGTLDLRIVNAIGLLMDIIGVLLVARYGLPPSELHRGGGAFLLVSSSPESVERVKVWDRIARGAFRLIIAGFVLQLVSALFGH